MVTFGVGDFIEWTRQLPPWQHTAARFVVSKPELSDSDVLELTRLAKSEAIADIDAPAGVAANDAYSRPTRVSVLAIRNIRNVNALGEGPITFAPGGLTIVFGPNASGKTGIARILKKTCWARDRGGQIRPNVFEVPDATPASAVLDFKVDDEEKSFIWYEGAPLIGDLQHVNVFDARCAIVQLEQANLITYTPAVLQLFASLGGTVETVASTLRDEKKRLGSRPASLSDLPVSSDTPAGQWYSRLTAGSDVAEFDRLANFGEDDKARFLALERVLSDDPEKSATFESARRRTLTELRQVISAVSEILSDAHSEEYEAALHQHHIAAQAAEVARISFASRSELPGIGGEVWRSLWEAAREYSEAFAYVEQQFPAVGPGAKCVLCQQELSSTAGKRLQSFEAFVRAETETAFARARDRLAGTWRPIAEIAFPRSVRAAICSAGVSESLGSHARIYLVAAKLRRRQLRRRRPGDRNEMASLPPAPDLSSEIQSIDESLAQLRTAANADARRALVYERNSLRDRRLLAKNVIGLRDEVFRLRTLRQLDAALATCKTQVITLKAREVAATVITDRLRGNFAMHLSSIGVAEAPIEVRIGAGDHGKHPYQMKLLPRPDIPPHEVLSDGERTCVALAGFLAELETTNNVSGIILDDPVSSLDHNYRKRVAEKLVAEAKRRQVVVFTHDVVFVFLLMKYADELNVMPYQLSLERGYKANHGKATVGPPWVAMPVKQRIGVLRNELVDARRILRGGDRSEYERRCASLYMKLRQSWERAIEEILLNGVVVRFGDAVQTQRLEKLTDISNSDVETVTREMSRCSDFVHDESGAVHAEMPDPDTVELDVTRLDEWAKTLRRTRGRT